MIKTFLLDDDIYKRTFFGYGLSLNADVKIVTEGCSPEPINTSALIFTLKQDKVF